MASPHRGGTYRAIARDLRQAILRQQYPTGVRLPTEAELAGRYQVSRQTIRRAFHDLVSEGMVYRVPGRGTFAASRDQQYLRQFGSVDDLMGLAVDTSMELLVPLRRRVDVGIAGRLALPTDSVCHLVFRRIHGGVPFCVTTAWLPPDVGALLEDVPDLTTPGARSQTTIIGLLDTCLDDPIAEADQSITVSVSSQAHLSQLDVDTGTPLLRIDRLYYDINRRPVELAISYFVPDLYSYRVSLRRSVV